MALKINSLGWRTRGAASATATNWMGSFTVTQFTKVGIDNLGWLAVLPQYVSMRIHMSDYPQLRKKKREREIDTVLYH